MLLFWVAYTFLYATALWSHLDAPGALYINSITARLGRPAIDASHFLLSAGLPLTNIPTTSPSPIPTPILIETPAPTPIPTSTRIPVPDTIIFPASPLPTARLRHKALPLCYDGLNDDLASVTGPATRTVTGTSSDLIVDGPGLITYYLLVLSALATALANHLVHSPACPAIVWILGLVCLSQVLFVMRRAAFESAAGRIQALSHCPCPCGKDLNAREVAKSEDPPVTADTSSPFSPSPPSTSPLKKLVAMRPALTKTGRLIARKQRNRGHDRAPVKVNGIPVASRKNSPPSPPPPVPVETDTHVWAVEDSSIIEYIPLVPRFKKHASPVAKKFADVD